MNLSMRKRSSRLSLTSLTKPLLRCPVTRFSTKTPDQKKEEEHCSTFLLFVQLPWPIFWASLFPDLPKNFGYPFISFFHKISSVTVVSSWWCNSFQKFYKREIFCFSKKLFSFLSVRFFQNFKLENLRESANNRFFTALKNAIFEKNTTDINEKKKTLKIVNLFSSKILKRLIVWTFKKKALKKS